MNQKEIAKVLAPFTNEQLRKEIDRRERAKLGKIIGYRATMYGDEMNYGSYMDFIIGKLIYCKRRNKLECKEDAGEMVKHSRNGGYVEELFKSTPKPSRIH